MIGKLLGGGIGFALGGPIGALLGLGLGYVIDAENRINSYVKCAKCGEISDAASEYCNYCGSRFQNKNTNADYPKDFSGNNETVQQTAFITILIALCAKMALADGKVDGGEVRVVKDFFKNQLNADDASLDKVKLIFKEAINSSHNTDNLLIQWKSLSNPQLDLELLNLLYKIALSDNNFHIAEREIIDKVVVLLEISETRHNQIKSLYINSADQYYEILGVSPQADDKEIKKAYRTLVTQYHPDKLVSKGLPEDMIKFATEKMNKINEAYEELKKKRKF
ncbi:MAG TPA: DnaJ domain-containing protein [bacterium]|nr:DnaJ domain-containing protein [bacterium]HPN29965.1 DnaJ domain-containing protein [bacterium]